MKRIILGEYVPGKKVSQNICTLTFEHREIIEKMLNEGVGIKAISLAVEHSRSTIYYERLRMGSLDIPYKAKVGQADFDSKKYRKNHEIPLAYTQMLRNVYRCLRDISKSNSFSNIRDLCKKGMEELNQTGRVNPKKFARRIDLEEELKILKMYKNGSSVRGICSEMDRGRSTVFAIIEKYKENLTDNIGDYTNERLESRWVD